MSTDTQARRTLGRKYYPGTTVIRLLEEVARGRSVVEICEDPSYPAASSFYNWCAEDPGLQAAYERARKTARNTTA